MNETASEAPPREISARIGNGHSTLMKIGGHIHLSPMERAVFNWLKHSRGGPREIAQDLGFKHASVRRVVQQLGDKGFVRSLGGTYEAALSSNPHILRNHSYDKGKFHEPVVSSKTSALACGSWHSRLQLVDNWHSEDASVQLLLDYLRLEKTGSLQSAKRHCLVLDSFCRYAGMAPGIVATLSRQEIEKLVKGYCNQLMEISRLRGRSARYANTALACLKTFFACNGFNRQNARELRIKGYHQPPRTTNRPEYVPTLMEALTMAERCGSKRDRAIILTLNTTGLRNTAARALKVGDILVELKGGKKVLCINVEASWNDRIPGACKGLIPYYTFTAEIATDAILSMLREREDIYGSYSPEEPLFISHYNHISPSERRVKPLTSRELQIIVKRAAKAADIPQWKNVRVHSLRKVFESVLRSRLNDGTGMDIKDQEFLMGHILPGSQENYYDYSKIEKMRDLYAKLVFKDRTPAEEQNLQTWRKIAKIHGVDPTEARATKEKELGRPLSNQEEEKLLEELLKKTVPLLTIPGAEEVRRESQLSLQLEERLKQLEDLVSQLLAKKKGQVLPQGQSSGTYRDTSKKTWTSVKAEEVDKLLAEGWEPIITLPDGRVVMKARSSSDPD